MSDAPLSRASLLSDSLGTFAWENMRVRRLVIVGFLTVNGVSVTVPGTAVPFGGATGSSGMAGWGKPDFPSCESKVEVEFEGEGVGGGRWGNVLCIPDRGADGVNVSMETGRVEGGWTSVQTGQSPVLHARDNQY